MASWEDKFVRILETDEWVVDYDREKKKYRVSYFEEFHFCDEIWFDAYEEKELDNFFPQTIGDITYYNKEELFEWVKNQQVLNKERFTSGFSLKGNEVYSILNTLKSSNIKPYSEDEKIEAERKIKNIISKNEIE